jgi:DNA polymerase-1
VSKEKNTHLREQAKIVSFGIIYGMGDISLAKELSISPHKAMSMLDAYFARFKRVKEFLAALEEKALKEEAINTRLGRRLI